MTTGEIFLLFVNHLEQMGIVYAVLGDTENYPLVIDSDVDIVLLPADYKNCADIIRSFAEKTGSMVVQLLQHESCASYYILAWKGNNKTSFIALDICSDYYRDGRPFIKATDLIKGQSGKALLNKSQPGFKTLSPDAEFIYYIIKKIDKGLITERHFSHLQRQFRQNPEGCISRMESFWPSETSKNIAGSLKMNRPAEFQVMIPGLKRQLHHNCRPTLIDRFKEMHRRVCRILHPTGVIIALLGPDGCGKSTLGDILQKELAPVFRGNSRFHLRPNVISFKKGDSAGPVTDPHAERPRGFSASVLKLIYFLLDYIFGFMFMVYPLKIRSNLILFDRYYHDLMIDPLRYRYNAPMWLAFMIGRLIPKPDLFLVLDAKTLTIQSRKQEVPFSETERQRDAYCSFSQWGSDVLIINTDQSLEDAAGEINDAVLNLMKDRINRRIFSN